MLIIITSSMLLGLPVQNSVGFPLEARAAVREFNPGPVGLLGEEIVNLKDFHLVTATEGWLLLTGRLYWTKQSGQSWSEITPSNLEQLEIQAVWFVDTQSGWLVLTGIEKPGVLNYVLAQTADGGRTWQFTPLSLFAAGAPRPPIGAVYLYFLDSQTGWLVLKQATSSNFSQGILFRTTNGGVTWNQLALPIGEPVYFVTPQLGWTVGGPAGDQLYHTIDGGQIWQAQRVGQAELKPEQSVLYRLPVFEDAEHGVLPVLVGDEVRPRADFYLTDNKGETWKLAKSVPLGQNVTAGTIVPIGILTTQQWLMILPGSDRLLSLSSGNLAATRVSHNEWVRGIIALNMATPTSGWARYGSGVCLTEPDQVIRCTRETGLLLTTDGGQNWTPLDLPGVDPSKVTRGIIRESFTVPVETGGTDSISGQGLGEYTGVVIGQGFDKCEIASAGQLQNWIVSSPYRVVNLYIGGSSRYCSNSALSSALVAQLNQQGWQFIPTWVGPQAACTSYISRMSYDLATAYNQGMSEANAAINTAYSLGLTLLDESGTIIYYDLEYYDTGDSACHSAARAFIAGWSGQLRARGNLAGVYSTASAFNGFASIPNVPDAIWPAHWIYNAYNPNATVWNVYSLSNSLWNNQQRVRQYSGGHNETWGGLTLNIDSNVIEGIVASLRQERIYLPLIERDQVSDESGSPSFAVPFSR
jgi:photosystem II stability/assembly factor-like uncharacterized protein